jgi:hypothetical protein
MRTFIILSLILLSFAVYSQDIFMLNIAVFDNYSKKSIVFNEAVLYNSARVLDDSFIDEEGRLTFIVDTILSNTDSVYFLIKTGDSLSSNTMIFFNKLRLLEINEIGNYLIQIIDFKTFTHEQYFQYCIKNGLIPRRNKTIAKDVD